MRNIGIVQWFRSSVVQWWKIEYNEKTLDSRLHGNGYIAKKYRLDEILRYLRMT
jgi:hypothetical protein